MRKAWEREEEDPGGLDVKRVGGSGCGWLKGDQVGEHLLVEVKTTRARTFPCSTVLMDKLRREAAAEGKTGIMKVVLEADNPRNKATYAIIPWNTLLLVLPGGEE